MRVWKLFLSLPRMFSRGGSVPKGKLLERFAAFASGEWGSLLLQRVDSFEQRAERAQSLAELGLLSSARLALELLVRLAKNRRSEPSGTHADG